MYHTFDLAGTLGLPCNKALVQAHLADCAAKLMIDLAPKEKATNYFADTICEFSEELTPEELYQALLDAMESYCLNTKKEFDHAKQLRDLITGFKND
jgi:hypothetical protein